jgi:hypothetical protein
MGGGVGLMMRLMMVSQVGWQRSMGEFETLNLLEYIYGINICLLYGYIYDTTEEKERSAKEDLWQVGRNTVRVTQIS